MQSPKKRPGKALANTWVQRSPAATDEPELIPTEFCDLPWG
jgi:hypothetical protein